MKGLWVMVPSPRMVQESPGLCQGVRGFSAGFCPCMEKSETANVFQTVGG